MISEGDKVIGELKKSLAFLELLQLSLDLAIDKPGSVGWYGRCATMVGVEH